MAEKEFRGMNVVDPDWSEHSKSARSKKVIEGPMIVPLDEASEINVKPVVGAVAGTAAQITLTRGKAYRLISSVPAYIRFAISGAAAADATDIYLPADTYVTVVCDYWSKLNFIHVSGGSGVIQAIEVE